MKLTDTNIRQTKPAATPIKLSDGQGMHLLINPNGSRYWRLSYRFNGKQKTISLGVYPEVSLKDARAHRDNARKLIANGTDPGELRKAEKITITEERRQQSEAEAIERMIEAGEALPGSFEAVALEWYDKHETGLAASYKKTVIARLRADVFPYMGRTPIKDVTASEVLSVLKRIEDRGVIETARRVKIIIGQVMRYAIATDRASNDPTAALRGCPQNTAKPPHGRSHRTSTDSRRYCASSQAIEDHRSPAPP